MKGVSKCEQCIHAKRVFEKRIPHTTVTQKYVDCIKYGERKALSGNPTNLRCKFYDSKGSDRWVLDMERWEWTKRDGGD